MDELELRERIVKRENLHTEFKDRFPDNESIAKSFVCFANSDGGQFIIGVDNAGNISGVKDVEESILRIDGIASERCEPPISLAMETVSVEGKTVVVVNIPKGTQKPYRTKSGRYYIRSGNRCRQASWEEVRRLYQNSGNVFYDESPVSRASMGDLDLGAFREFLRRRLEASPEAPFELEHYLQNLKVMSKARPTLAGLLFFGEKPQEFVPFARVAAAYIRGLDLSIPPADKKDLTGTIPEILENTLRFLQLYMKEEHRIRGFEPEVYPEIPSEVLREGIVNAVAHRDYTVMAPVRLFIFEDRIEIRTPGNLPNTVTVENMRVGGSHVVRNPTIYNLLIKIGMVTDTGSGVFRMIKLMKEKVGKDIEMEAIEGEFKLVIPRK